MLPQKIAFVDLETTGGSALHNRIIEIGIVKVVDGIITQTFSSLVNPHAHIPPEIERLTGIKQTDVTDAPTFHALAKDIHSILSDCTFVAHNVRFDYGFLKAEFARSELPFTAKHFCTVRLSRTLYPSYRRHNLDALIERFGFSCASRHRALDDARVIHDFYHLAKAKFPEDTFEKAVSLALKKPAVPLKLKHIKLDILPEQPGVYIMYGSEQTPLYVGKSINIKDRVRSHFSSDIRSPFEMKISQQVERVEAITTPGELGALILESNLIKKMLPLYNRKLRIKRELIALRGKENHIGYMSASIAPVEKIHPNELTDDSANKLFGIFPTRRLAKQFLTEIAKSFNLCEKLLGLESGRGACFAHRLGTCFGACLEKEHYLKYNMRFLQAISEKRIKPWPFPGPITIEEKNELTGENQYFFLDKWCYLGSVTADRSGSIKHTPEDDVLFDMDLYKILLSYLRTPKKLQTIKQLSQIEIGPLLSGSGIVA